MSATDEDRATARHMITSPGMWVPGGSEQDNLIECVAHGLAAEREKARAPFLAILDVVPDIQPLWEFERGMLRGIEMAKAAIRKAADQ